MSLVTGPGGTLTLDSDVASATTQGDDLAIDADRFLLGRLLNLGSQTDAATDTLKISQAELTAITAGLLRVGNNFNGAIILSAAITSPATNLSLASRCTIGGPGSLTVANLKITAGDDVVLGQANHVSTFAASVPGADHGFTFNTAEALEIGTVDELPGLLIGGTLTLTAHGITQTTPIIQEETGGAVSIASNSGPRGNGGIFFFVPPPTGRRDREVRPNTNAWTMPSPAAH